MFDARLEALPRIVAPAAILSGKAYGGRGFGILLHPPFPIVVEIRPELSCCFGLFAVPPRCGLSERQHRQDEQPAKNANCQYREQTDHPALPAFANSLSRSCASITMRRAVSSMPMAVLSTSTASAARTSGETLRSRSRLSRSITSSKTSASVIRSPFSWCSFQRRSARTSGEASRKIFSSALGKTTVPISRPSITTPPPAPARCCSATSTSRTLAIVASRDAACATSEVRISGVTSAPSRKTQFFAPDASCSAFGAFSSMCVSFASASRRDSFSNATWRRSAFSASARYIAPLSRYKYPSIAATRRATLLLPEPAGPSMAMVSFGIFVVQPIRAMRLQFEATTNRALARVPGLFLEPHDVVAAIDEDRLAGYSRARFGKQECGGRADLGGIDIALEGGALHLVFEHVAEVRNPSRCKRFDGPCGNGVDAHGPRPKVVRQIADRRFQRRLRHAHYVVVRNHFLGTVVRQRDHPAAGGHERGGAARYRNQRIDADVMRDAKTFARSVQERIFQLFRRSKPHAVHQAVQHAVSRLQFVEQSRDLIVFRHVAHESSGARHFGDQIPGFELEALVLIGNRQPPAGFVQFFRDSPRDAALVREAENHCCLLRIAHSASLPMAGLKPGTYKSQIR